MMDEVKIPRRPKVADADRQPHLREQSSSLLVRAMLGVPSTQQCEAQYQDGRRCTETLIVTICASAGRVAGPTTHSSKASTYHW